MTDPGKPRPAFAPWDRRELPGLFDVEETARRVGNYKWIEMRLFEALGGWVATVPELDVKMRLGTHCYHHAWREALIVRAGGIAGPGSIGTAPPVAEPAPAAGA